MKILLTGGCGFIGSHIADAFVQHPQVQELLILDNLSTGSLSNIRHLLQHPKLRFVEADIRDADACTNLAAGAYAICHQAALGSVPRSIADPQSTHAVNLSGFLNVLNAARTQGVQRVVYASSSSVYGHLQSAIKTEDQLGRALSPYAVTKQANEAYAEAFARCYDMELTGFRYFNVFGPRQNPEGPYAAVIPLFVTAALQKRPATIYGDGTITRDFTYVSNVVKANLHALLAPRVTTGRHAVYNIACGQTTNLLRLWEMIGKEAGYQSAPVFGPPRKGDILYSLAAVDKAAHDLQYTDLVPVEAGIAKTVEWYRQALDVNPEGGLGQ